MSILKLDRISNIFHVRAWHSVEVIERLMSRLKSGDLEGLVFQSAYESDRLEYMGVFTRRLFRRDVLSCLAVDGEGSPKGKDIAIDEIRMGLRSGRLVCRNDHRGYAAFIAAVAQERQHMASCDDDLPGQVPTALEV